MQNELDLKSTRAQKARLASKIGPTGFAILLIIGLTIVCFGFLLLLIHLNHFPYILMSLGLAFITAAIWYHQDLLVLTPTGKDLTNQCDATVLARLNEKTSQTPRSIWHDLSSQWQVAFMTHHFLLDTQTLEELISVQASDMQRIWAQAQQIKAATNSPLIEPYHIATAILLNTPGMQDVMTHLKLKISDIGEVTVWLSRLLESQRSEKPYFGGIGRDWANGFTPQLNQFGHNISLSIEANGGHYLSLTNSAGVQAIKSAFSQGAAAIALVGETGIGKTSHVHALAQLLLAEKDDRHLEHRQIIELNASYIISSSQQSGVLENIVNRLMHEAAHAGHIILFLDDAQLFFGNGVGSFDATQILLPILQSRAIQIIFAMTPHDYQNLKVHNSAFAALLTPVVLTEPDQPTIMHILEDTAVSLEAQHHVLISYAAIIEAVRLSGRYEQDEAYPGKAIRLVEQSLSHANSQIVTIDSVQQAIEQTHGVKVGSANQAEADALLHLEDDIHKRMINQSRAVEVVSNALRRSRAGVSNPKRPIGSFLFLGPTGVGKTELAKAIAATYFGAEANMIRLDMSEYQQAEDVSRLLSDGSNQTMGLILAVRQQPFSVVLLDEIEKSHPNILNLLLQLLDEGQLTDSSGRPVSFKDCIIIATSNAGAQEIRDHVSRGEDIESFESTIVDNLINSNQFKAELLNRFDEIVLFRPLNQTELLQVVGLMLSEINQTLAQQNIKVQLTQAAAEQIVTQGYDARLGARPMRRMLQRTVEDEVAKRILRGATQAGDTILLDIGDLAQRQSSSDAAAAAAAAQPPTSIAANPQQQ
jgi:ATP-dependent Clp protease ATP-binding subunit ClpC